MVRDVRRLGGPVMTPEGRIKNQLRDILARLNPEPYYFMPATGGYGRNGVPDIVGCYKGRFFGIECKVPGGMPTTLQTREMWLIEMSGGVAFVYNGNASADEVLLRIMGEY